jgi:threonine/homoserine/homoserine lactone efflux protein
MDQIALYLPGIALAYAAFFLGIASPGPNVLAILGTSMSLGRRPGVALALGIGVGSIFWAILTVAGLSAVLASYAEALTIIKIAGGLYLLWLAFKAFRSAASAREIVTTTLAGANRRNVALFLRGLAIQMTNPKAVLAWIAIMSLGVQQGAPLWVDLSLVIGTGILSIAIHTLYAVAFSTATMVRVYGKARRSIQAALGAFFCFAGFKLLTSRL